MPVKRTVSGSDAGYQRTALIFHENEGQQQVGVSDLSQVIFFSVRILIFNVRIHRLKILYVSTLEPRFQGLRMGETIM